MSKRLQRVFEQEARGATRLIAYLMAGDPGLDASLRRLQGLAEHGIDVLEVGVPFSDPMADGPVIQAAAGRALAAGMTVKKTLGLVEQFRRTHETPVLLMSYLNPLLQYGWEQFVKDAVASGVDGLILPDLPWQEGENLRELTKKLVGDKLTFIPMIAQTSQEQDIKALAQERAGFVYVLSQNGVTGVEAEIPPRVLEFMNNLQRDLKLPRCVGFGISKAEQVRRLAEVTDGVIIGSALVNRFALLDQEGLGAGELYEREREIFSWLAGMVDC